VPGRKSEPDLRAAVVADLKKGIVRKATTVHNAMICRPDAFILLQRLYGKERLGLTGAAFLPVD
jgi:hypothetical protein